MTEQPDDHFGADAVGFKWTEEDAKDDRWRLMDTGPFFSGTLGYPGGHTLKGLAIKLGDKQQAGVIYDTELLRVSCGWTGGFLKFNSFRFGLISAPLVDGKVQFVSPVRPGCTSTGKFDDPRPPPQRGPLPRETAFYRGLSLSGNRVVLNYAIAGTTVLETPWVETSDQALVFTREFEISPCGKEQRFLIGGPDTTARLVGTPKHATLEVTATGETILVVPWHGTDIFIKVAHWQKNAPDQAAHEALAAKSPPCRNLQVMCLSDVARWKPVETRGTVSTKSEPYVIDTLTLPFENPYHALMFTSGHDFFANGDAAVCTAHGDVWVVSGIDEKLERLTWRRFATGLFQPLGLKIIKSEGKELIHVLGRDQITVLYDENRDGEADFYLNFNNEGEVTTNSHEFATCLETDSHGHLYYLRGDSGGQTKHDGCLLRVTPDGSELSVYATGFRNANGLSIGPDDTITVAPQEGAWTPGSAIFQVKQGGFYGAMQSHHRAVPPTTYDPPICWLPRLQDNSSGGQTWVTSDRWGPLKGQLLHFSFGTCRMFLVPREQLADGTQGGTVQFPLLFDSGVMRGRFHPVDGQLYVTGLKGWVSSAVQDGCFQRVRYTSAPVDMPVQMKTWSNGMALTFTEPLDPESAEDPDNYGVEAWNYLWSSNYGSPDYKVSDPSQVGHDELQVVSATLLADRRTVFLELPTLRPAMQVSVNYTLQAAAGRTIEQTYYASLQKLGSEPQPVKLTKPSRPGQLDPAIEKALIQGLVSKIETSSRPGRPEVGISRLAAIYAPRKRVEVVAGPQATVTANWTGYLKVQQKGSYLFRVETSGAVQLKISGRQITFNEPVALRRGHHPIELTLKSENQDLQMRLLWKAPHMPWEGVPPTQLSTLEAVEGLWMSQYDRLGRDAYRQFGCGNCHTFAQPAAGDNSEWRTPAPGLARLGERLNPDWIAAWIQRPRKLNPAASMPIMFHGHQANADRQAIADIALFLTSNSAQAVASTLPATAAAADDVDHGLQLYESLGCIACHRFSPPDVDDTLKRQSLHVVAQKFRAGQIAEFLQNPRRHAPSIRMPDFRLTADEARFLEAYLRSMSAGKVERFPELATANVQRGRQQFAAVGCRQCHQLDPHDKLPPANARRFAKRPPTEGCITPGNVPAGIPKYELSNTEYPTLKGFLIFPDVANRAEFDVERTQREMRRLNCQACHSRDGKNSPLAEVLADEGQGRPPEMLPHLTWSGEKLRTDWLDRLVHGKLTYQTRPWLTARMPSFPANHIAQGLAAEHGLRYDAAPMSVPDRPSEIEIGKQLTLKGQGLDCRQCHGLGNEKPSGDQSTLISIGINFNHIPDRLNPEFYPRLMLNPPRYDPNSRMPVFAVDGQTTAAKGVLNGDAAQQFDAIWEYLRTLKP